MGSGCFVTQEATEEILLRVTNVCAECYDDIHAGGFRTPFIALRQPVVPPKYESKEGWWIAKNLASKMDEVLKKQGKPAEFAKYYPWKNAEEYMRLHLHNSVRISQICQMANTSERVLEYAFNKIYGLSPKRYLTILRLNKARKLLKNVNGSEANVTSVAMSCGFRHMGRFSAEYKNMFGELPSRTLSNN